MKTTLLFTIALFSGCLLHAQDWMTIDAGSNKQMNTIDFVSGSTGFIGGNDSLFLKTTDGGMSWAPLAYSGVTFYSDNAHILKIDFVSELIGFMTTGPYGGTYKTVDGGSTWQSLFPSSNFCFNSGLLMQDENNGFVGGSGCFQGELIERQTAGSWNQLDLSGGAGSSNSYINDFSFQGQLGLAASNGGIVYTTSNGGTNWSPHSTPLGVNARITSVEIVSPTLFYAGYQITGAATADGLLYSTDGGLNWLDDVNSATFPNPIYYDLFTANSGRFYALGDVSDTPTGTLLFTNDYATWFSLEMDHPLRAMQASSATRLFAVGDSGLVITNEPFEGLAEQKSNLQKLTLFPNPAKEHISVFNMSQQNQQAIEIFDQSGRKVMRFEEQTQKLDISILAPGFYKMECQNDGQVWHGSFVKE